VADDPEAFAAACVRLLTESDLRRRLVDEAEKVFLDEYQWSGVGARIKALVGDVAHQSGPSS
jgi:glycosyltransferase involved in cell wall biosynthesis